MSHFLEEFLACNGFLGYFPKLKSGPGIASGAYFPHDFPIEMFRI